MTTEIKEEWKPIKEYEGVYEISNFGRVRSVDRIGYQRHYSGGLSKYHFKGKEIKPNTRHNGYICVSLHKNGVQKTFNIHRLVALHFLEKPEGKEYVNHKDSDPTNNNVNNLEWCTQSENIQYAYDQGRKIPPHTRKIGQYGLHGNFIKEWNSEAEISRSLNIPQGNIYKACRGLRITAGGYKWKYIQ